MFCVNVSYFKWTEPYFICIILNYVFAVVWLAS